MADKVTEALLEALKLAQAEVGEQRLFKSGKLSGLFAGKAGVNGEAATRALRDGLLEVARTETKGKTSTEWVRLTPAGIRFLHENESPIRVLEELRDTLRMTREGMPVWVAEMQQELRQATSRLTDSVQQINQRLDALGRRVDEALRRADLGRVHVANGAAGSVPWAHAALAYLDQRQETGFQEPCPLPELFAALRPQQADLTIPAYLDGLGRLNERRAVQLWPFAGPPGELPEPEYALLDGATVLYYVTR